MPRLVLLAILSLASLHAPLVQAENIILFIGDGMGFEQVRAANYYNGGQLSFEEFLHQAGCTTHSVNSALTDSAASGTAIATGVKVNNGVISLKTPGDGCELETLLEFYQKRGKKVGLITTAYLTHATPAAFAAHEPSRNNTGQIGGDYLYQTRPNLLFGGGGYGLDPISTASAGYGVATDSAGFYALDPTLHHLAALFGNGYMPYEEDYLNRPYPVPHLTEMVIKALDALEFHPNGFFLMVEAGRIDHACHDNKLPEAVHETLELSHAVAVALIWAAGRNDTTILVTADHETGGLTTLKDNGAGQYPTVTWSSRDHTAANVPVYAWGRNAELVSGTLDNTDFFNLLTAENTSSPMLSRVASAVMSETSVKITWTTDVPADSMVDYRLSADRADLTWTSVRDAIQATDHTVILTGLAPDQLYEYRVTSMGGGAQATSAIYTFAPASQLAPGMLIAAGSTWKYNDTGTDLGAAWREPAYDDSGWKSGRAKLGYGDGDEATVISYGSNSSSKFPCYYFRHTFSIDNPFAFNDLSLRILRDDGAVVHLNGIEVARYNMPSGAITYTTYASTAADYPWDLSFLIPNLLVAGLNVLAVEVHQGNASSSDLALDLELTARSIEPDITPPLLSGVTIVEVTDRSAMLAWTTDEPADSWVYYGTTEDLESQTGSSVPTTVHTIELTGLSPNTLYNFQVSSMDAFGNQAYGLDLSFTTLDPVNQPIDYNAYAIQNPTVTYGSVAGDYTALHPDSTGTQTLTEQKVGPNGRLDVEYLLQTSAHPDQINTMTLRLAAAFKPWDDAWQIHLWSGAAWAGITADILNQNGDLVIDPLACVDHNGFMRVRFTDSAAIRAERLDSISIEHLYAEVSVGPIGNRAPVAADDTASTFINQPVLINLLSNDSDPDGDLLFVILPTTTGAGGTLTDPSGGIVIYTPPDQWSGIDTFEYSISDGEFTDTASVSVTVIDDTTSPGLAVHVDNIVLSAARAGKNWKATASVTIVDQNNAPAPGATVYGDWLFNSVTIQSGSTAETDSAGVAVSSSPTVKADMGTFTFRVTDVQLTGNAYASDLNTFDENSIQVP